MKPRRLKVEDIGDFSSGVVVPRVRLTGKWLGQAGFKPGTYVTITFPESGKILVASESGSNYGSPSQSEKPSEISQPGG